MRFVRGIVLCLFVVFSLIAAVGICLVYWSIDLGASATAANSQLEINASGNSIGIKITTAIPGLIVFVIGGVGLLTLLIKVPVHGIASYEDHVAVTTGTETRSNTMMTLTRGPRSDPVVSREAEKVPLLLWWFLKARGRAVRVRR